MICLHASVLGTNKHLVCRSRQAGFTWTDTVPERMWLLGPGAPLQTSLVELAAVHGQTVGLVPSGKYARAAELVTGHIPIPGEISWRHFMTATDFRAYTSNTIERAFDLLQNEDVKYYAETHVPMMEFLNSMQRANIDSDAFTSHLSSNVSPALRTFVPDNDGFAKQVIYTKTRTKTGRLIVTDGPDILTLPRVCRDIIVPSEVPGVIAYVDYASMEPRFVLGLAGREIVGDVYNTIGREIDCDTTPRDVLKAVCTSVLYGAGAELVARLMSCTLRKAQDISHKIDDYFQASGLRKKLEADYRAQGFVRNVYGKRVYPDGPAPGLLLNNFAQSSGADGAILGFMNGTKLTTSGIKILFVLHDACFVDVSQGSGIKSFVAGAERIPGLDVKMPLSVKRLGV